MVLIDGINALYYECIKIRRPDRTLVPPHMITAFEAFKLAIKPDWVCMYVYIYANSFLFGKLIFDLILILY
jgi:hypothetical protein